MYKSRSPRGRPIYKSDYIAKRKKTQKEKAQKKMKAYSFLPYMPFAARNGHLIGVKQERPSAMASNCGIWQVNSDLIYLFES